MAASELVYVCEICQTILDAHHCKAVCPNCGRMLDCSDLPFMAANASFNEQRGEFAIRSGSDPRDWLPKSEPEREPDAPREADSVRDLP